MFSQLFQEEDDKPLIIAVIPEVCLTLNVRF